MIDLRSWIACKLRGHEYAQLIVGTRHLTVCLRHGCGFNPIENDEEFYSWRQVR